MGRPKGSKTGSVFFNKSKGKWFCEYYVIDKDTHKEVVKQKTVSNEEEGKQFLSSLQYQKGNEIFIKNNGICLGNLFQKCPALYGNPMGSGFPDCRQYANWHG